MRTCIMPDQSHSAPCNSRRRFNEEKPATLKAWTVIVSLYFILFIFLSIALAPNGNTQVYITRTGECYHKNGCSSLISSKFQRTLEKAVGDGYRPCNNCDPPRLISADSKITISLATVPGILLRSFALSIFVWGFAVTIFYFLGIPEDQIRLRWYPVSAIIFHCLIIC